MTLKDDRSCMYVVTNWQGARRLLGLHDAH